MKLLVAVDGSDESFDTLKTACYLANKIGYSVIAFYVNRGEEYTPELTRWPFIHERLSKELSALGNEVIKKSYSIGRKMETKIEGIISSGTPADEIIEYTQEHGIVKMLAIAHSSKSKGVQTLVESTVKEVVIRVDRPLLVTSRFVEIKRIVFLVQKFEPSDSLIRCVANFACNLSVPVLIFSTFPDLDELFAEYSYIGETLPKRRRSSIRSAEKIYQEQTEKIVNAVKDRMSYLNVNASSVIVKGDMVEEVFKQVSLSDIILFQHHDKKSSKKLSQLASVLLESQLINTLFLRSNN
jgi:nucleotide-binding universal stress UspA family protein